MKKSKTITKIFLWIEYIGVGFVPFYVAVASILIIVFYGQYVKANDITDFMKKDFIPCVFALLTIVILPAVFRWRINETKNIEAEFKKLKEDKDGTL